MERNREQFLTEEELLKKIDQENRRMMENPLIRIQTELRDDRLSWKDYRDLMRAIDLSLKTEQAQAFDHELESSEER